MLEIFFAIGLSKLNIGILEKISVQSKGAAPSKRNPNTTPVATQNYLSCKA